jgi:glycosyltransferase involved in cell wall biosynthesis
LVAVDDGSTDGTTTWLAAAGREDSRIRLLARPPEGIVGALNAGIGAARGELIARFDADDECLPDRLERQRRYLEDHPDVGAVGSRVEFGGDDVAQAGYATHVAWLNTVITPRGDPAFTVHRVAVRAPEFDDPSKRFSRSRGVSRRTVPGRLRTLVTLA